MWERSWHGKVGQHIPFFQVEMSSQSCGRCESSNIGGHPAIVTLSCLTQRELIITENSDDACAAESFNTLKQFERIARLCNAKSYVRTIQSDLDDLFAKFYW